MAALATWICTKCGKPIKYPEKLIGKPMQDWGGKCKADNKGLHIWVKEK